MLNPQVHRSEFTRALLNFQNSYFWNNGNTSIISVQPKNITTTSFKKTNGRLYVKAVSREVEGKVAPDIEKYLTVKTTVTAKIRGGGILSNIGLPAAVDAINDFIGETFLLELVSSELDPTTGEEKKTIKGFAKKVGKKNREIKYESVFEVPADFGELGAVLVQNEEQKEMYIKTIVLDGFSNTPITITCDSWVCSKYDNPDKRIFFPNKSYLPTQTPEGLKKLREEDLDNLRGNGDGERKKYDRIYDYDKYNDLGNPDSSEDLARPVIGGHVHPYPRRCRTGRPPTQTDPLSEQWSGAFYVPRDEAFSDVKQTQFSVKTLNSVLRALVPSIQSSLIDPNLGFDSFTAIDSLFNDGLPLPKLENQGFFRTLLPRLIKTLSDGVDDILQFETPELIERDRFSWFSDKEFARQTLAGVNPYSIQLVTELPLKSKLDPEIYGPAESAITKELIDQELKGVMTAKEALNQKKLFMMDYHDLLLPFVNKVRELEGTTLYGSRTLFFLMQDNTLRPLAIELTRPPIKDKPQWKQVYTPSWDATDDWLWVLAKCHVLAHDCGYHELVVHWLRAHACVETYIIATNRQLSTMHPIYRLLHPHLRYTMEINSLARQALINGGGIIETSFSPAKYSMEISSAAYDQLWRFDMEALPKDLIRRGMAVEDPKAEHGLKLTIEDYPFANDGLLIWHAIKEWVTNYVNHYYPESDLIQTDQELQEWWTEIRTKGHEDKKDEPWWPILNTPNDLIEILATIIWGASAHHAAVNFGQYPYGGYFPNRPSIARTNMPDEDPTDEEGYKNFMEKPEFTLLKCLPSQIQATIVMAVLDILSSHSSDEEYLGGNIEPSWKDNSAIKVAFERFKEKLLDIEGIIDARNANLKLKNRSGAGVVPYQLLKPFSEPGVTGMGVPNSVSI